MRSIDSDGTLYVSKIKISPNGSPTGYRIVKIEDQTRMKLPGLSIGQISRQSAASRDFPSGRPMSKQL
eukprot:1465702-Rhodomonas_salina.2